MNLLSNNKQYTVSELNNSIKKIIEGSLGLLRVKGEISQIKKHSSGHIYFSLKDEKEVISSVCWRSLAHKLTLDLKEGDEVIIEGRITTYSPQSKYQLIVGKIEYEGEGTLLKLFEETKKKLLKEGLFDENFKKKIPYLPSKVAVITSQTGAVIKDIIHRIRDRFPIEIIIFPVNVQGDKSSEQIISAVELANQKKEENNNNFQIDVIIIARGGGSLEDLMPFNDEKLVKSIFKSSIPIISAIGHETDITLCDFVSDLRAPTPTAAAEFLVPVKKELLIKIKEKSLGLTKSFIRKVDLKKINLENIFNKVPSQNSLIQNHYQKVDFSENKLNTAFQSFIKEKELVLKNKIRSFQPLIFKNKINFLNEKVYFTNIKLKRTITHKLKSINQKLEGKKKLLYSMSYKNVLRRGFSVTKYNKKIIRNGKQVPKGADFEIEFFNSRIKAKKIDL